MTIHTTPSPASAVPVCHSRIQDRSSELEKSYQKYIGDEESEREWFASVLRKAFPARTDHQRALDVAEVLTTERRPVHPKTVMNWLSCANSPHFRYVIRVLAIAGAESIFQILDPEAAA